MEIEPERIPRPDAAFNGQRRVRWTVRPANPLTVALLGVAAVAFLVLFLFFMFWAVVLVVGLGLVMLLVNKVRGWLGGGKGPGAGQGHVTFSIERRPPER